VKHHTEETPEEESIHYDKAAIPEVHLHHKKQVAA